MQQKGFTLLELILYIAIVSVVLLSFTTFALRFAHASAKARVVGEVEYNAKLVQDRMIDAIRHAEAVNDGASTFGSDPGVLSLDMVDAGEDPTVFSLTSDDGSFQVNIAGAGDVPITSDRVQITNLFFTDLTTDDELGVIQVQYTVTAVSPTNSPLFEYEQSYQTTLRIPLDNR